MDLRIWTSSALLHSMRFNKYPVCNIKLQFDVRHNESNKIAFAWLKWRRHKSSRQGGEKHRGCRYIWMYVFSKTSKLIFWNRTDIEGTMRFMWNSWTIRKVNYAYSSILKLHSLSSQRNKMEELQQKVMTKSHIASERAQRYSMFTECKEQGRSTSYLSASCIGNTVEGETW